MSEISASMVKELREKTGAGMMDCKRALTESSGDLDNAVDFLRKSGIAKAAKKADRATTEGKIASHINETTASMVEVLCETDFVAKNDQFSNYCDALCLQVSKNYDSAGDLSEKVKNDQQNAIIDLVAKVGENIQLRRVLRWESNAKCASYIHTGGKIGVIVEVKNGSDKEYLSDLCMHIAAFNPLYLSPDDVPESVIEKEKEIAAAQPELAGKPKEILEKILMGKVSKWYKENCLLKQIWIKDDKKSVEQVDANATILRFVRWQIGEAI